MNKQFSKEEIELDGTYGKFPNLTNESGLLRSDLYVVEFTFSSTQR